MKDQSLSSTVKTKKGSKAGLQATGGFGDQETFDQL